jgi:hypothetical protein
MATDDLCRVTAEARRWAAATPPDLARGYIDSLARAGDLAHAVREAADDDFGTMIVARAVLPVIHEEHASRIHDAIVRHAALERDEAERRRYEAMTPAQRHAEAVAVRRHVRTGRLRLRLAVSLGIGVVYCGAVAGVGVSIGMGATTVGIGVVCAVAIAACLAFEWFAGSTGELPPPWRGALPTRDAGGAIRFICLTTGLLMGLCAWMRLFLSPADQVAAVWSESLDLGPISVSWTAATLPIAVAVAWIVGGCGGLAVQDIMGLSFTLEYWLFDADGKWPEERPQWLNLLGPLAAASTAMLHYSTRGDTARWVPQWHILWAHPYLLIALGMLALLCHAMAKAFHDSIAGWDVVALVAGILLGFGSLFVNPDNVVTRFVDGCVHVFAGPG